MFAKWTKEEREEIIEEVKKLKKGLELALKKTDEFLEEIIGKESEK